MDSSVKIPKTLAIRGDGCFESAIPHVLRDGPVYLSGLVQLVRISIIGHGVVSSANGLYCLVTRRSGPFLDQGTSSGFFSFSFFRNEFLRSYLDVKWLPWRVRRGAFKHIVGRGDTLCVPHREILVELHRSFKHGSHIPHALDVPCVKRLIEPMCLSKHSSHIFCMRDIPEIDRAVKLAITFKHSTEHLDAPRVPSTNRLVEN